MTVLRQTSGLHFNQTTECIRSFEEIEELLNFFSDQLRLINFRKPKKFDLNLTSHIENTLPAPVFDEETANRHGHSCAQR